MKNHTARRTTRLLFILAAAWLSGVSAAQAGFLMWQAQRDGKTIHVLADIHFVTPDALTPLAPEIHDALDKSTLVLLEMEMERDRRKAERRVIIDATSYEEGDNLLNHLPAGTVDRFNRLCEKLVIHNRGMIRVKPWAAAYNLKTVAQAKMGMHSADKLDQTIYQQALSGNKQVDFMVKGRELVDIYGALPHEIDVKIFEKALRDIENMKEAAAQREAVWLASDAAGAAALVDASFDGYTEIREALQLPLQAAWADELESQLRFEDDIFVLLGLDRLVGRDNLLDALKARGFTIAQVIPE